MKKIENDWQSFFIEEQKKTYFKNLKNFLDHEYNTQTIYPQKEDLFKALELTSLSNVKVVIIGQDPYHQPNQAHGLAFSVLENIAIPPSLKNMFKEIESEFEIKVKNSGNLERWARQGVLLLNTVLTVREGFPNSHKNKGWEDFTTNVIKHVCKKDEPVVFLLWGNNAQSFEKHITNPKHLVLKSPHPSPLSSYRGFFGNNHFALANKHLQKHFSVEIDWR